MKMNKMRRRVMMTEVGLVRMIQKGFGVFVRSHITTGS